MGAKIVSNLKSFRKDLSLYSAERPKKDKPSNYSSDSRYLYVFIYEFILVHAYLSKYVYSHINISFF
jgi:hypothetical protein